MKIKSFLAYKSFFLIKVIFGLSFLIIVILNYYILDELHCYLLNAFCLITGIFIGYCIAFYAIKFLQKHPYKK